MQDSHESALSDAYKEKSIKIILKIYIKNFQNYKKSLIFSNFYFH